MNRVIIGLMIVLCVVVGAGVLGILDSRATDVFLEATRPDFQKIPIGVFGFQNGGGPEWLGGRLEEVLKADLQRSLVFSLVDLPGIGARMRMRRASAPILIIMDPSRPASESHNSPLRMADGPAPRPRRAASARSSALVLPSVTV